MTELLALPRRSQSKLVNAKLRTKSALPLNSLPGWENIPLYSKLPMLKCPDNHVIFSKNKIGQTFKHLKHDFDSRPDFNKNIYNPLHDSNLKRFYSNERNLKRLRENGEITQQNDVICNLKDFNEYRRLVNVSNLLQIRNELKRMEEEHKKRQLIEHAEACAIREQQLRENRSTKLACTSDVIERRQELQRVRAQRLQQAILRTEGMLQKIAQSNEMRRDLLQQKKVLHIFKIKHCLDVANDIQRKRLIALKKQLQFKNERLKNNEKRLQIGRLMGAKRSHMDSWNKRLNQRIYTERLSKNLMSERRQTREANITKHHMKYKMLWRRIQLKIAQISRGKPRKTPRAARTANLMKKLRRFVKKRNSMDDQISLRQVSPKDLSDALYTAIDIQESKQNIAQNQENSIYKVAKYILENILANYNEDLSNDDLTSRVVMERTRKLFDTTKEIITKRATHIIATGLCKPNQAKRASSVSGLRFNNVPQLCSNVSFSNSQIIGFSSYNLNPWIELKPTFERPPTPAGSLTSVVIDPKGVRRSALEHLNMNEQIFVEHLFIKFRRELFVGVGRRVFTAIDCHYQDKIMNVRKELLELDKNFLVNMMGKSILSYAINKYNFQSNLRLCIHALASDIIWTLQKNLIRPERDCRTIAHPTSRCFCTGAGKLNLFCNCCV